MKQMEIERIQHLDLDDIDLISRYSEFVKGRNNFQNGSKPNPLVPMLDFTKIFEWRDKQNELDKEEALKQKIRQQLDEDIELSVREDFIKEDMNAEHYEEPSSIADSYK